MRVVRIGGVHEPYNLPIIQAIDQDAFRSLGLEVTFSPLDGGTGALVEALEQGWLDLATLVTEGAVTAMAHGRNIGIHSTFTTSALRWGVHVAHKSKATKISDLQKKKFAISRHGSGSHLIAHVLADKNRWKLKPSQFVVTGGLDGAVESLAARKAHVLLWERYITASLVHGKALRRVGDLSPPWPGFVVAYGLGSTGENTARALDADKTRQVCEVIAASAASILNNSDQSVDTICDRYGMTKRDARSWLAKVKWSDPNTTDVNSLNQVGETMKRYGLIDHAPSFGD